MVDVNVSFRYKGKAEDRCTRGQVENLAGVAPARGWKH